MKTWKLVSGILSIVLFIMVAFQSCAVGIGNTLGETGEVGGSAGIIVAIMLLAGGIVSIATRKGGKGGNIALIVLFGIGALLGVWISWKLFRFVHMGHLVLNQRNLSNRITCKK